MKHRGERRSKRRNHRGWRATRIAVAVRDQRDRDLARLQPLPRL